MIVWGGTEPGTISLPTGARYDPATDSWTPTQDPDAPRPREDFTAVWTGNLLVIYGGHENGVGWSLPGHRYDPVTGSWSPMSIWSGNDEYTAVWTGDEIIYWALGGFPAKTRHGRPLQSGDRQVDRDVADERAGGPHTALHDLDGPGGRHLGWPG